MNGNDREFWQNCADCVTVTKVSHNPPKSRKIPVKMSFSLDPGELW